MSRRPATSRARARRGGPLTPAGVSRRFVVLTGLRWLPTGLVVPVMVLLASSRGLSPAQIGLVFTVQGAVVVALELPTGGLADALGRRAVLAAGGLLHSAGLLVMAGADSLAGFCLAYAFVGVGRALDSGPLEAWYVDTARALDPQVDVTPALARAGVADGAALCLGAVLGGLVPVLVDQRLWLPIVVAAALALLHTCAVLLLVVPVAPPAEHRRAAAALRQGLADVPRTVSGSVRLARRDPALRLVLGLSFGTGLVLTSLELLVPLRIADLNGDQGTAATAYGVVVAGSFAAAALGSGLAPRLRVLAGGSAPLAMAALFTLSAGSLLGLAAAPTLSLMTAPYVAFYLLNGATWPLRKQLLHERAPAAQRATMVSAASLALQLGGMIGNNMQARLYQDVSPSAPFAVAAAVLLVLAGLCLRLRKHLPGHDHQDQPAAATSDAR